MEEGEGGYPELGSCQLQPTVEPWNCIINESNGGVQKTAGPGGVWRMGPGPDS